ncbi:GSCFA domain-containing protein [Nonlabens marinus]|uniref:GSCFA domain-containing protein n=1 Tax=Nonlabens marinus S1-08 TaxID=1454201 RepID=W8VTV3_9FLAO|nr:GSCFA domain-containing protein [Nonlabens marinus]BAO54033.1 hypothetical protein NMS_0024 [Nonlabens marinus S1-08]
MKFTTPVEISPLEKSIDYDSSIVLLGSCFSQNIGDQLSYFGFQNLINPFGTLFNPHSMATLIEKSLKNEFTAKDVQERFSYFAHSDISGANADDVLTNLKDAGRKLKHRLKTASHLIITLGTAWVYELKENGEIVANCHQQPQKLFNKRLLELEELTASLQGIENVTKSANPDLQIIYTLSPVRHTKDGMVENTRSKARLHEVILQQCERSNSYYFPAYEILMDELRDYRFYAQDMLHPNATAVDYVWLRFRESVLHQKTATTLKAVESYRKLAAHRPKNTKAHQEQLEKSLSILKEQNPQIHIA